jgi:hypothetical protein
MPGQKPAPRIHRVAGSWLENCDPVVMFSSAGKFRALVMLVFSACHLALPAVERINHEGRILGTVPVVTTRWQLHSGPTNVAFANAAQTNTTAYDAVVINVVNGIRMTVQRAGTNATLRWTGGIAPFRVESVGNLPATNWTAVAAGLNTNSLNIVFTNSGRFYRVRGQYANHSPVSKALKRIRLKAKKLLEE